MPHRKQRARPKKVRAAPSKWRRGNVKFRFIDLFAGIGGMRLALERVGGGCVYACEIDRHARETYQANFEVPDPELFPEDINEVTKELKKNPGVVPDHDLLVGGFPCQPFSLAGIPVRKALGRPQGFECPDQGNLFLRIMDILNAKQPSAFLLENVKHLRSHDEGRTFRTIMGLLERDYHVQYDVLNANRWLPQNRERIFLVGFRKNLKPPIEFGFFSMKFFDPGPGSKRLGDILERESDIDIDRYTLTPGVWRSLQRHRAKHEKAGKGFGYSKVGENDMARTLTARYYKDGAEILIDRGPEEIPRRLTPRECARLMGFPERPKFRIPAKMSDVQLYRQFGNSVAVPVVEHIGNEMLADLQRIGARRQSRRRKR